MAAGSAPYHVLHLICSPERRGAELFAMRLASYLEGELFENALCSLYDSPYDSDNELPTHLRQFSLSGGSSKVETATGFNPGIVYRLSRVLHRIQPDLVMAHGGETLKYAGLAKLMSRKSRTIYKNIGTASFWARSHSRVRFNKLLLRGIDVVVSVSQFTRRDFVRLYRLPSGRVVCIPNGMDISAFDSCPDSLASMEVRQELGISPEAPLLVIVGNLSPEKGHQDLLQLMADLRSSEPDTQLLVAGDGPLRQELEQQSRSLGVAGGVHFLGTRSDVPRLLAASDLFVLPSRTEGMPGCLIEAGLSSLPSVAYEVGGVAEVVQHGVTGLLVPSGNYQGMFQAVAHLCRDPQHRRAMGLAARQRCSELFDIRNVVREYEKLFTRLLGRRSALPLSARAG